MKTHRIVLWIVVCALGALAAIILIVPVRQSLPQSFTVQGAVIRRDADTRKQVPITGATVYVFDQAIHAHALSAASGYFSVSFHERVRPGEMVHLEFRAPNYQPLNMEFEIGRPSGLKGLIVAEMDSVAAPAPSVVGHSSIAVSNVHIRYTVNYRAEKDIGTDVTPFQVVNRGNVPCRRHSVCSPNGLWQASRGSVTLEAGSGNVLRNVRASCIAGPCPFTKLDIGSPGQGGHTVAVSAVDWSDTATFLVEAEVFHQSIASSVRDSYPVIYGRVLHFTVPPTAEGPSIEAAIGGTSIVFPLGKGLFIDWGTCTSRSNPPSKEATIYQCELKPGYHF